MCFITSVENIIKEYEDGDTVEFKDYQGNTILSKEDEESIVSFMEKVVEENFGEPLLHVCAVYGYTDLMVLAIEHGVDYSGLSSSGMTVAEVAEKYGHDTEFLDVFNAYVESYELKKEALEAKKAKVRRI